MEDFKGITSSIINRISINFTLSALLILGLLVLVDLLKVKNEYLLVLITLLSITSFLYLSVRVFKYMVNFIKIILKENKQIQENIRYFDSLEKKQQDIIWDIFHDENKRFKKFLVLK